ncbi:MAG: 2-hydroxyacid dehydrogenase [Succinivibrio sp.]|nr:2-hydroxyacid dehydrogenase [Succinivibrio sp.]
MEKITFYGTHSYDRRCFAQINEEFGFELCNLRSFLSTENARMTQGARAVCIFVNDRADREVLTILKEQGVELLTLRCAGFNNVDLKAAAELGIKVTQVPAYSPHAIAEHAVALLLTLNRKTHRAYIRTRDGNFALHGLMGFDLYGKTAGIFGTGRIARELIRILQGFGLKILAYDPYPDEAYAREHDVTYVSPEELYARADIISLNCPLTEQNRHLINAQAIARMKKGVFIINTGRGPLIDTAALIEGLRSGQVGAAGLDVYEDERDYFYADRSDNVITDDHLARLLSFNNVLITSHQAFFTEEAMVNIARTTLQNCKDFFEHTELKNEVKAQ